MVAVAAVLVVLTCVTTQAFEIRHNEAYEAAEVRSETPHDFLQASTSHRLEAIMATMTTESALRAMPAVPRSLKALIVEKVGANASQLIRTHNAQTVQGTGFLQAAALHRHGADPASPGVDGARNILNDMIKEAGDKLDLERVRCSSLEIKLTSIIEETIQDISEYNAQAADARARVLKSQTIITTISETMPKLQDMLTVHKRKCLVNIAALDYKLRIIRNDIRILDKVVSMTQCASSSTAAGFLQCEKKHALGHGATSFMTFSRKSLREKVAELKSKTAKAALQEALRDIYATARPLRGLGLASVARRENLALAQVGEALVMTPPVLPIAKVNASGAVDKEQQNNKCSVANSPNCNKLRDKFLLMQTNIGDQAEQMADELAATRKDCEETQINYESQIAELETRLKDAQTMLAEATKELQIAQENSRMKEEQKTKVTLERRKSMSECRKNIDGYVIEICGIRKIRLELYKMSDMKKFIRDCEVAAWAPGECSAPCAGGIQQLTRLIVVPAEMGAGCPPLSMSRDCNEQECPVDCRLSSWSGWSSCSALCNGGVMSRARVVRTQAQHGGTPCGSTTDTEPCNIESCDKDCELSSWTRWGGCSKACDGGFQRRVRHVSARATGEGACPKRWSKHRFQYKTCNSFKCTPVKEILECTAKLDVVLLLDGSGSIGSNGWAQTKKAATTIINAFQTDVNHSQVAVLSFSGPSTYKNYLDCTGNGTDSQGQPVNYADQCKIAWVSHFSTEKATIVSAVDALAWPRSSTLTSAALATAEAELGSGRKDAEAIVIVITDGRPMNPRKTYQAAQKLKKKARLMFVPVTTFAPLADIRKWASRPVRDNVLKVDKFSDLAGTDTINELIADACPEVK